MIIDEQNTRRHSPLIGLLIVAVLLGLALASGGVRTLLAEAFGRVTISAVLATLPGQIAALLLCAAAFQALMPGVAYRTCLAARLLRDAGGSLPFFLPGFGEAIGVRALVLAGGKTRTAVSASALDIFAETVAQLPYSVLAGWVLWHGARIPLHWPQAPWAIIFGAVMVGVVLAVAWLRFGAQTRPVKWLRAEWRKLADEARQQRAGLPRSMILHFSAWVISGVQIWMAARALNFDLSLIDAFALKSAADVGRTLFFFVPAGLGGQEAALVAAGLVLGLDPGQSLALGLAVRLRDVLLGAALLIWPLLEWRSRVAR